MAARNSVPGKYAQDSVAHNRRLKVEEMMLRGMTNQTTMAAAFGVKHDTISKDVKYIRENWWAAAKEEIHEKVALRVKQLEHVLTLCFESYTRSRHDEIEITTVERGCDNPACKNGLVHDEIQKKNSECQRCFGEGKIQVETRKVKGRAGDSAFLSAARATIVEISRLEGAYPSATSALKRTIEQTLGPDGAISQKIEELYIADAPFEDIISIRAALDKLLFNKKQSAAKPKTITVEAEKVGEDERTESSDQDDGSGEG